MPKRAVFERSRRELPLDVSVGVHILVVVEQSILESQSSGFAKPPIIRVGTSRRPSCFEHGSVVVVCLRGPRPLLGTILFASPALFNQLLGKAWVGQYAKKTLKKTEPSIALACIGEHHSPCRLTVVRARTDRAKALRAPVVTACLSPSIMSRVQGWEAVLPWSSYDCHGLEHHKKVVTNDRGAATISNLIVTNYSKPCCRERGKALSQRDRSRVRL